jgi:hypothetical protein
VLEQAGVRDRVTAADANFHQFAAGRPAATGEETAVHARLLEWALEVARSADAAPSGFERAGWSGRLAKRASSWSRRPASRRSGSRHPGPVVLGAAWSAYQLGDHPRAAPLAADGIACAGSPANRSWRSGAAT